MCPISINTNDCLWACLPFNLRFIIKFNYRDLDACHGTAATGFWHIPLQYPLWRRHPLCIVTSSRRRRRLYRQYMVFTSLFYPELIIIIIIMVTPPTLFCWGKDAWQACMVRLNWETNKQTTKWWGNLLRGAEERAGGDKETVMSMNDKCWAEYQMKAEKPPQYKYPLEPNSHCPTLLCYSDHVIRKCHPLTLSLTHRQNTTQTRYIPTYTGTQTQTYCTHIQAHKNMKRHSLLTVNE